MIKNFYLFRHGETDWNKCKKLQGHNDIPLNSNGLKQAEQLIEIVSELNLEAIYSSDLKRALKTAEIVINKIKIPLFRTKKFRECFFGEAEGLTYDAIIEKYGEDWWDRLRGPNPEDNHSSYPGGESPAGVHTRVMSSMNDLAQNSAYQRIGISTHGGVLRNVIHSLIPNDLVPIPIPNCIVYMLQYNENKGNWTFNGQISRKDNGKV